MRMQPVLTKEQARAVTSGRTPLVPVEYESAVKALQSCLTLDEAKYWHDKADALAAWAKIYRSDEAGTEARRLKLHAFRRMGELAQALRPFKPGAQAGMPGGSGARPGAPRLLVEQGLKIHEANACSAIAKIPTKKFESIVNSEHPPVPGRLLYKFENRDTSESWRILSGVHGGNSITSFAGWCKNKDAYELAQSLRDDEAKKARILAIEIAEWIDAFEQALPK